MILALVRRAFPDPAVLLAVGGLLLAGSVMVRAATMTSPGELSPDTMRQMFYATLGLGLLMVTSQVPVGLLRRLAPIAYLGSLASLVAVLVIGTHEFGAQRWIELAPGVTVQPSEFAKVATLIAVAAYAADREPGLRSLLASIPLVLVPMGLVVIEPDLGTTLVMAAAWGVVIATWGVRWRLLGGIFLLGLSVLPIAFAVAVPDYQRERLAVFLDPGRDPLGSGFTMRQVEIALGGGGLTGRGIEGAPSALDGVSTRASDFAFAQLGEQMGLLGALLVLALYAIIAWRGLEAAIHASDRFGRLLAAGLTATIVLQALMHIGVNTHLFPAKGIPLPFVSTGGSAILGMCLAAGLIQAVAAHRAPRASRPYEAHGYVSLR